MQSATPPSRLPAIPITVLSRREAESYRPLSSEVCISISDPHAPPAELSSGFAAVRHLAFDDIEAARTADDVLFGPEEARAVVEFVREHRGATRLVIHCDAGARRSPGMALGISDAFGWPTAALEDTYPAWNPWVRSQILRHALRTERGRPPRGRAIAIAGSTTGRTGWLGRLWLVLRAWRRG